MHGRYNFMNLVNDLKTFDDGLYKNLMFLKTYTVRAGEITFNKIKLIQIYISHNLD